MALQDFWAAHGGPQPGTGGYLPKETTVTQTKTKAKTKRRTRTTREPEGGEETIQLWEGAYVAVEDEIWEKVLGLMEQQKVTKSELARRLGVHPSVVTNLVKGGFKLRLLTVVRLLWCLGHRLEIATVPFSEDGDEDGRQLELADLVTKTR